MLNYNDIMDLNTFKSIREEVTKNKCECKNKVEVPFFTKLRSNTPYLSIVKNFTYDEKKDQYILNFIVFNENGRYKEFTQRYSCSDYARKLLDESLNILLDEDEFDDLTNVIGKECIVKLSTKDDFTNVKVISRCEEDNSEDDSEVDDSEEGYYFENSDEEENCYYEANEDE